MRLPCVPWFVYVYIDINLYISRKLQDEDLLFVNKGINKRIRSPYNFNQILFFQNQIRFYDLFFQKNNDIVLIIDGKLEPNCLFEKISNWIEHLPDVSPLKTLNF